jgi:hypothetical protein
MSMKNKLLLIGIMMLLLSARVADREVASWMRAFQQNNTGHLYAMMDEHVRLYQQLTPKAEGRPAVTALLSDMIVASKWTAFTILHKAHAANGCLVVVETHRNGNLVRLSLYWKETSQGWKLHEIRL